MACLGQTKANTKKIDAVRRGATGCPQWRSHSETSQRTEEAT
jgi:hypothetical protein